MGRSGGGVAGEAAAAVPGGQLSGEIRGTVDGDVAGPDGLVPFDGSGVPAGEAERVGLDDEVFLVAGRFEAHLGIGTFEQQPVAAPPYGLVVEDELDDHAVVGQSVGCQRVGGPRHRGWRGSAGSAASVYPPVDGGRSALGLDPEAHD